MRIIIAMALALSACSSQAQEKAEANQSAPILAPVSELADHPISGLKVIPLTVSQNGNVNHFTVEVASNGEEQARGLMFRTEMGPNEGMIFPRSPPRQASFWMKNTVISLDIIFIGVDGRVSNISANAVPYSLEPRPSDGLTIAVLELNGGRAAELGIMPGAKVEW